VYVADVTTYELLFMNHYGRTIWGEAAGRTCWQTLQSGQGGPCAFCTNARLILPNGEPAPPVVWEFQNTVTKHWYECRDQAIRWSDGRLVRMEIATDITDRKHADMALRESEKRHKTIVQTAMDGFWLADTQGNLLEVNEAYCRMSGYSAQELLAMKFPDLEVSESATETAEHIQKVMQKGEDRFETRHRRKDGGCIDIEISVQYRPEGIGYFIVFLRDITERKRAENALRISSRYSRSLIEASLDPLVTISPEGKITDVNEATVKVTGVPRDMLIGTDFSNY
jgi:PAS domain S-box-containing protein